MRYDCQSVKFLSELVITGEAFSVNFCVIVVYLYIPLFIHFQIYDLVKSKFALFDEDVSVSKSEMETKESRGSLAYSNSIRVSTMLRLYGQLNQAIASFLSYAVSTI